MITQIEWFETTSKLPECPLVNEEYQIYDSVSVIVRRIYQGNEEIFGCYLDDGFFVTDEGICFKKKEITHWAYMPKFG